MIQSCLITVNIDDARAIRSRSSLLDAALEVLANNPTASISEIAERAGVGRATLYRHFETRENLVRALAQACLERTDIALEPIQAQQLRGREALETAIRLIMPLAQQFHFLLSLWSLAEHDPTVREIYD